MVIFELYFFLDVVSEKNVQLVEAFLSLLQGGSFYLLLTWWQYFLVNVIISAIAQVVFHRSKPSMKSYLILIPSSISAGFVIYLITLFGHLLLSNPLSI